MSEKIVINPLTRISGFLQIEVQVEKNVIIDAKSSGMMFRGFEKMLKGRSPLDATYFTERICGICSTAHAIASTMALENALEIKISNEDRMIRDFMHGSEFLQNHLRHFYQFTLPDYIKDPFSKDSLNSEAKMDYRLPKPIEEKLAEHYIKSLEFSRKSHQMLAILGGKAPHSHGIFTGGVTVNLDSSKYIELKSILFDIKAFITDIMIPDVYIISKYYSEYFSNGAGYNNLMSYGVFDHYDDKDIFFVGPGVSINNFKFDFNPEYISEGVYHSWYMKNKDNDLEVVEDVDLDNKNGYSFIKTPRYAGYAMEVGPLARMILGGLYDGGISTMDRTIARVLETEKIACILQGLLEKIKPINNALPRYEFNKPLKSKGLIDTTRGTLGHWISIDEQKIKNYSVISPSTWNLSPKDQNGVYGVVEKALIGTYINDVKNPIEIGRIVRSFDPCVSCATHVVSDRFSPFDVRIN